MEYFPKLKRLLIISKYKKKQIRKFLKRSNKLQTNLRPKNKKNKLLLRYKNLDKSS